MPSAFRVARDASGSPGRVPVPVRGDLRAGPAPDRGPRSPATLARSTCGPTRYRVASRCSFLRHMLAADGGEATTPAHAALILDLKRRYLELRARAAAHLLAGRGSRRGPYPSFAPLGFARLPDGAARKSAGPRTTPSTTTSGRPPSMAG